MVLSGVYFSESLPLPRQTTQVGPIVDALPDDSIPCYRDAGGRTLLAVTAY
jgi:hypothetical protein